MVIRAFRRSVWCATQEILNGNGTYALTLSCDCSVPSCVKPGFPFEFAVKPTHRRHLSLILRPSWPSLGKAAHVVAVQSLPLKWCSLREANGIASVSSAKTATRHSTQSSLAMVLTRTFTVELVMARSGDRTATDLPAVLDSCKLMVRGSSLTRLNSQLLLIF